MSFFRRAFYNFFSLLVGMPQEGATVWEYLFAVGSILLCLAALTFVGYLIVSRCKMPLPPEEKGTDGDIQKHDKTEL